MVVCLVTEPLNRNGARGDLVTRAFQGNARVEILAWFFFRSVANRSQVLITPAQPFESDACATF